MGEQSRVRLAVDIGGTFTDIVLEAPSGHWTQKVLTTPSNPADGFMTGADAVLERAGIAPEQVDLIIHGTTLATNALIERKGAKTALIVTEGHRDSLEIAYENRFDQYDLYAERPAPLSQARAEQVGFGPASARLSRDHETSWGQPAVLSSTKASAPHRVGQP